MPKVKESLQSEIAKINSQLPPPAIKSPTPPLLKLTRLPPPPPKTVNQNQTEVPTTTSTNPSPIATNFVNLNNANAQLETLNLIIEKLQLIHTLLEKISSGNLGNILKGFNVNLPEPLLQTIAPPPPSK